MTHTATLGCNTHTGPRCLNSPLLFTRPCAVSTTDTASAPPPPHHPIRTTPDQRPGEQRPDNRHMRLSGPTAGGAALILTGTMCVPAMTGTTDPHGCGSSGVGGGPVGRGRRDVILRALQRPQYHIAGVSGARPGRGRGRPGRGLQWRAGRRGSACRVRGPGTAGGLAACPPAGPSLGKSHTLATLPHRAGPAGRPGDCMGTGDAFPVATRPAQGHAAPARPGRRAPAWRCVHVRCVHVRCGRAGFPRFGPR
jgi:hypothetical protein